MNPGAILAVVLAASIAGAQAAPAGTPVKEAQIILRERKLFFGNIDGKMSRELRHAIREYQKLRGFESTGRLDRETLAALGLRLPALEVAEEKERAEVHLFLERYLNLRESGDLDALGETYADVAVFYDDGKVSRDQILAAHREEAARWPYRRYVLLNRIASEDSSSDNRWIVTFRYRAEVGDGKSEAAPVTEDNTMVVQRSGSSWQIVSLRLVSLP